MDKYPTNPTAYNPLRNPAISGFAICIPNNHRRFVIAVTRPEHIRTETGTYVAFTALDGHSSDAEKAIKRARKVDLGPGMHAEVLDTETGERIFTGPVALADSCYLAPPDLGHWGGVELTNRPALAEYIETAYKADATDWVREAATLMNIGLDEGTLDEIGNTVYLASWQLELTLEQLIDRIIDEIRSAVESLGL